MVKLIDLEGKEKKKIEQNKYGSSLIRQKYKSIELFASRKITLHFDT